MARPDCRRSLLPVQASQVDPVRAYLKRSIGRLGWSLDMLSGSSWMHCSWRAVLLTAASAFDEPIVLAATRPRPVRAVRAVVPEEFRLRLAVADDDGGGGWLIFPCDFEVWYGQRATIQSLARNCKGYNLTSSAHVPARGE